jgi:hypothetical protein
MRASSLSSISRDELVEIPVDLQPLRKPAQQPGGAHRPALDEADRLALDHRDCLELVVASE